MKTLLTIMKDLIKQQFKLTVKNLKNGKVQEFKDEYLHNLSKIADLFTLKDGHKFSKDFEIKCEFNSIVDTIEITTLITHNAVMHIDLEELVRRRVQEDIQDCHTSDFENLEIDEDYSDAEEVNYSYTTEEINNANSFNDYADIKYEIKNFENPTEVVSEEAQYKIKSQDTFEYLEELVNFMATAPKTWTLIEEFEKRTKE